MSFFNKVGFLKEARIGESIKQNRNAAPRSPVSELKSKNKLCAYIGSRSCDVGWT